MSSNNGWKLNGWKIVSGLLILFQDQAQKFAVKVLTYWGCSEACLDAAVETSARVVATIVPRLILILLALGAATALGLCTYKRIRQRIMLTK